MTEFLDSKRIQPTPFVDALSDRYLSYALSTITSRSLPDVRDGLKPVHRRLLYAMRLLRLSPNAGFKKCARVVGDVIGKYHPHGEVAVYDALVRLAQDFSVRYPLVEGQGNFGNIDGDNAAAMRYTEARLTDIAEAILQDIDEDTVDFRGTYDGEDREPLVLPAAFPNLLANGANGVAVGMATSIPPHNAVELIDGLIYLLRKPNSSIEELLKFVPGPDFPTGGTIVEPKETITESYETGRGSFRLRAKWRKETLTRAQYQIVVTELPYQVQKARLIEKIADLIEGKKLPWLADVVDESTDDVRLILVPRARNIDAELFMQAVFQHTDLEVKISLNLNVLDKDNIPRVMSLKEALRAFLEHRLSVLNRRTEYRKNKIETRLEILNGYLIVYVHLDELIKIIRESDKPEKVIQKRWKLTDIQVQSILAMRLRQLKKLEQIEIKEEHDSLSHELRKLIQLLKSKIRQKTLVESELKKLKKRLESTDISQRKTKFETLRPQGSLSALEIVSEKEPVTIVISEKGWIRSIKNHLDSLDNLKFKEGDGCRFVLHGYTNDRLVMLGSNGRFYTLLCEALPSGRGFGEPVRLMVDLGNENDFVSMHVFRPGGTVLVAGSDGRGFVVKEDDLVAQTRAGKQILNVPKGVVAVACCPVVGDTVASIGENHKLLLFGLEQVPSMNRGRGVIFQRFRDGLLSDVKTFQLSEGLTWRSGERSRTYTELLPWTGKRGQNGRLAPRGFPKSNKFGVY